MFFFLVRSCSISEATVFSFQIWNLGSPEPNFTLEAHVKGVNCVDYFTGGDRPYLITGSDDQTAKVGLRKNSATCALSS